MIIIKILICYLLLLSIISGIFKGVSFESFVQNNYKLLNKKINHQLIYHFSYCLILIEIVIPFLIYFINGNFIYILLLIYILATLIITYSYFVNNDNFCGCYGNFFQEKVSIYKISENVLYINIIIIFIFNYENELYIFHFLLGLLLMMLKFATILLKNINKGW